MTDPYDKIAAHMEIEKAIGGQIDFPIVDLLTAAGFRLLAPGDLDKVTLERCAKAAEAWQSPLRPGTAARLHGHRDATIGIAAAIRSLGGGET